MKTILKYGVITGIILLASELSVKIPVLNIYFDSSIFGAIKFVVLGSVMLFTINDFLKNHNSNQQYNYGYGFIICFGTGVFGLLIHDFFYPLIRFPEVSLIKRLPRLLPRLLLNLPLLVIFSIFIPLTFKNKPKAAGKSDAADILDSNLD